MRTLTDRQGTGFDPPVGVRMTHIGGPTVLLEVGGWRILTDPTFDPPGRTYGFGWGTSSRKLAGPAVSAKDLGEVDAVLLTHDHHSDNLDDSGRALLGSVPLVVTTQPGARRLGRGAIGLKPWATTALRAPGRLPVTVTATPCRHGPPLSRPIAGAVIGFALAWEGQRNGQLWISGDSVLYDGLRDVARRVKVDTAILHLGAVGFPITGPVRYTMTALDAVELTRTIRPRLAIPVHFEGWSHFREGLSGMERALHEARLPQPTTFRILEPGKPEAIGN
jgi:L-ascorbate metabolism protein UlaG (beta-lactamase superfamily)